MLTVFVSAMKKYLIKPIICISLVLYVHLFAFSYEDSSGVDLVETKHFAIFIEKSVSNDLFPAGDAGVLFEAHLVELDKNIGSFLVSKSDNQTTNTNNIFGIQNFQKCHVYIYRDKKTYLSECEKDVGYASYMIALSGGYYSPVSQKIFMFSKSDRRETIKDILHEITHYYCEYKFPGGVMEYPVWFREIFSLHFENYTWNGDQLTVGDPRCIYATSEWEALKTTLENASQYQGDGIVTIDLLALKNNKFYEEGSSFGPESINELPLGTNVTRQQFCIMYRVYALFGSYLISKHPNVLRSILHEMSRSLSNQTSITREEFDLLFDQACRKAMQHNSILLKDFIVWVDSLPIFTRFQGQWIESDDRSISCQSDGGILVLRSGKEEASIIMVNFVSSNSRFAVLLSDIDWQKYDFLQIQSNGDIEYRTFSEGQWQTPVKTAASLACDIHNSFECCIKLVNQNVEVYVNDQNIYSAPAHSRNNIGVHCEGDVRFKMTY